MFLFLFLDATVLLNGLIVLERAAECARTTFLYNSAGSEEGLRSRGVLD